MQNLLFLTSCNTSPSGKPTYTVSYSKSICSRTIRTVSHGKFISTGTYGKKLHRFHTSIDTGVQAAEETTTRTNPIMADDSSASLATRIIGITVVAGVVIGTFLPLANVIQNASSDVGTNRLEAQLSRVPIFTVTDANGRPFMSETEDGRLRRGYFFVQPADAQKFLENISADNDDAKVLTISLSEAYKFLDGKPVPSKSVPERFELFPDDHELELAQAVTGGNFEKVFGKYSVPIFYLDGLGIQESKQGGTVYPLFFEKEKLDETVKTLKKNDPSAELDPKDVQVIDLRQTIKEIKAGSNPRLNNVVFVPLEESLAKLRKSATS